MSARMLQLKHSRSSKPDVAYPSRHGVAARPLQRLIKARVAHPGFPDEGFSGSEADDVTVQGAMAVNRAFGDEYFQDDVRPVILFDGNCNLCNGGVQFVLDFDKEGLFRFASLQSDAGKALLQRSGRKAEDITSIVLVNKQRHWVKSQAVLHIAQDLKAPFPVLQAILQPIPGFVRDTIYEAVADNRYRLFGEADSCRMMLPEWRDRFLV